MAVGTFSRLPAAVRQAVGLYHRLVLLVGPAGSGKTTALGGVVAEEGYPLVNVGLELSRRLLELDEQDRRLRASAQLDELVRAAAGRDGTVLLDNTEILFAPALGMLPLESLQALARVRTVVASWSGVVRGGRLVYAEPDHPEYRSYSAAGLLIVEP